MLMDIWGLIQNGQFDEACKLADFEFEQTKNIFPLRNKIYALMHLKRYDEVILLTEFLIKERNGETDTDFIFCGIAYWLKNNRKKAIEIWQSAVNCKYTDAAGGIELQIIIYFSGVKCDNIKLIKESTKKIEKLLKSKKASNWPSPIGKYIINEISIDFLFSCLSHSPIIRVRQLCQMYFVKAIKELEVGNESAFINELNNCISLGPSSYLEQFYYLAKGEIHNDY